MSAWTTVGLYPWYATTRLTMQPGQLVKNGIPLQPLKKKKTSPPGAKSISGPSRGPRCEYPEKGETNTELWYSGVRCTWRVLVAEQNAVSGFSSVRLHWQRCEATLRHEGLCEDWEVRF